MGFHLGMAAGLEAAARPVAASTLWPLRLLPEHLAHHDRRTSLSPELQRKALLTVLIGALVLARSFDRAGWNGRTTRGRHSGLGNRALFEDGAKWREPAETPCSNSTREIPRKNPAVTGVSFPALIGVSLAETAETPTTSSTKNSCRPSETFQAANRVAVAEIAQNAEIR